MIILLGLFNILPGRIWCKESKGQRFQFCETRLHGCGICLLGRTSKCKIRIEYFHLAGLSQPLSLPLESVSSENE